MAKKVFDDAHIADIANTIRDYSSPEDSNKTYKTSEMKEGIINVYINASTQGYNAGRTEGYSAGYDAGIESIPDGDEVSY